jgi:hypothetical protein
MTHAIMIESLFYTLKIYIDEEVSEQYCFQKVSFSGETN